MINITEIVTGSGWKNFMKYLYGWGATLVIVGALFKLQHWKGAGTMLTIGMSVEAVIFFFSAFEPIHEEVDWTLVYPELAGMSDDDELNNYRNRGITKNELAELLEEFASSNALGGLNMVGQGQASVGSQEAAPVHHSENTEVVHSGGGQMGGNGAIIFSQKFDDMLANAEIGPELFEKVSHGLRNLSKTAGQINSISEAALASEQLKDTMANASQIIGDETNHLSQNYGNLSESMNNLSESYQKTADSVVNSGNGFVEQMSKTGEEFNSVVLGSGQAISGEISNSANQLIGTYAELAEQMKGDLSGIETTNKTYQEKLSILNKNVEALNAVHEMNIQMVNAQMEESKDLYSGMNELHSNLKESIEATQVYKSQVDNLNQNLEALNQVYGNMLSALNVVK